MELVETPIFTRQVTAGLDPDDYRLFQLHLLKHPDAGAVIRGSGGLRKVRWGLKGRGKSGGVRIIYFWDVGAERLYLLFLYPKNERSDLTREQLKTLRKLVTGD
jgi:mRNA-degrading endonuclease RelE of RelBE toxin-antitoxin system